ncbi:YeiH/YadS family membrane protein [Aliarcobacter cibarius]|uniref:YeiH family protein n=1 Tax=Aliarcobacter cibarius TaxID=255507 RepID=UPI0012454FCC|nr:YeiH family protein [Aliarcobacter cibarius]QEZ88996.1 YeiH/YadS family membrane protein [Aliarcobacter cibarius]
MKTNNKIIINTFIGIIFVGIIAYLSTIISKFQFFDELGISPLIVGIFLGMIYANTIRLKFPSYFKEGIIFATKYILRLGIILYGFRLTFQNLEEIGINGILLAFCIVFFTFIFGYIVGVKLLKMDKELAILCSAGSSICGAAAVMATQSVLRNKSYKSAVAVSFVVIFGTIGMFLFPLLDRLNIFGFTSNEIGLYLGAILHEVAHVVGASNALGTVVANNAIIEKMIRVIFLVPFLIVLSFWLIKTGFHTKKEKSKVVIPWFALFFIVAIGFNSLELLEKSTIDTINFIDNFALTMAMCALGMETSFDKFKNSGMKPFYLSLILFIWLIILGYILVKLFF